MSNHTDQDPAVVAETLDAAELNEAELDEVDGGVSLDTLKAAANQPTVREKPSTDIFSPSRFL